MKRTHLKSALDWAVLSRRLSWSLSLSIFNVITIPHIHRFVKAATSIFGLNGDKKILLISSKNGLKQKTPQKAESFAERFSVLMAGI